MEARDRKRLERTRGEAVRVDRMVEIVIRDSQRPLMVISLRREDQGERWGRWKGIGPRGLGAHGVGEAIAMALE